jgi:selenocysteine-specific elongation factor
VSALAADEPPLTVGTAGHVDHGKSELVRALSAGARTDRLPEERERGMTIALGYAPLRLPGGRTLSLIDVPGHERLVRVMVSGASGIDMFLLVIAADDGVMPQTVEHLCVLRALDVSRGVVAVTKADLADPAPALSAARELLPGVQAIACSARTGAGVAALAGALERVAAGMRSRAEGGGGCVLHIDRVFSIHGAGTVLTGTLWSGELRRGERLRLLPDRRPVRVRAIQVHDEKRESAAAGQRVAVNVTGATREHVRRGDVLASEGMSLRASRRLDCALELHGRLADHERVQVHHGTRESAARFVHLGGCFWQVRLERPLLAAAGDRLVVRRISIPDTLGGGTVLDADARRHGPGEAIARRLEAIWRGERPPAGANEAPPEERDRARATGTRTAGAPAPLSDGALALESRLRAAGPKPPSEAELGEQAGFVGELRAAGRAVRVGRSMYAHPQAIADVSERVREIVHAEGSVTLARLRDELDISRRHAQALLEHLDAARLTLRRPDDTRVLRRGRCDVRRT